MKYASNLKNKNNLIESRKLQKPENYEVEK